MSSSDATAAEGRVPVTTAPDLATLDDAEILEGYRDGLDGGPEPGGNRSRSYWHGWRNGRSDRTGKVDEAQRELVRAMTYRDASGALMLREAPPDG